MAIAQPEALNLQKPSQSDGLPGVPLSDGRYVQAPPGEDLTYPVQRHGRPVGGRRASHFPGRSLPYPLRFFRVRSRSFT